jgi:hypothetical protein
MSRLFLRRFAGVFGRRLTRFLACLVPFVPLVLRPAPIPSGVFDVRDHGAVGDGRTADTAALQRAIDACAAAGGGQVRFSPGTYLSGTLHLRSRITILFEAGSRLVGTTNLAEYRQPSPPAYLPEAKWGKWHRALLLGEGVEDVTIAGLGTIDGNRVFDPTGEERMRGPHTLVFVECRRVLVRDVTFVDAANYAVFFQVSDDVEFRDVTFVGGWDGIHWRGAPERWCHNVKILGCRFATGDDAIAGRYWDRTLIAGCVVNSSCNGIRLIGPATHLTVTDCLFQGPGERPHLTSRERRRTNMLAAINLQPGAWDATTGPLDDVLISDVTIHDVTTPFHFVTKPGNTVGRITVQRASVTGAHLAAASVESWAESPMAEVVFRDVTMEFDGGGKPDATPSEVQGPGVDARRLPAWGFYARHVGQLVLDNVRLRTSGEDLRPAVIATRVDRLRIDDLRFPVPAAAPAVLVWSGVGRVEWADAAAHRAVIRVEP